MNKENVVTNYLTRRHGGTEGRRSEILLQTLCLCAKSSSAISAPPREIISNNILFVHTASLLFVLSAGILVS